MGTSLDLSYSLCGSSGSSVSPLHSYFPLLPCVCFASYKQTRVSFNIFATHVLQHSFTKTILSREEEALQLLRSLLWHSQESSSGSRFIYLKKKWKWRKTEVVCCMLLQLKTRFVPSAYGHNVSGILNMLTFNMLVHKCSKHLIQVLCSQASVTVSVHNKDNKGRCSKCNSQKKPTLCSKP